MFSLSECYEILNLNEDASYQDVKNAYKNLVFKYHPDKGGDVTKMAEINYAFRYLKDNVDFSKTEKNNSQYHNFNSEISLDEALNIFSFSRNNVSFDKIKLRYNQYINQNELYFKDNPQILDRINKAFNILKKEYSYKQNTDSKKRNNNYHSSDNIKNDYNTSIKTVNDALLLFQLKPDTDWKHIKKRYKSLVKRHDSIWGSNLTKSQKISDAYALLKKEYSNDNYNYIKPIKSVNDALNYFNLSSSSSWENINRKYKYLVYSYDGFNENLEVLHQASIAYKILKREYFGEKAHII